MKVSCKVVNCKFISAGYCDAENIQIGWGKECKSYAYDSSKCSICGKPALSYRPGTCEECHSKFLISIGVSEERTKEIILELS